ncbi:hypothetical protein Vretimale_3533 [Volvox reticuliferus]|uniref:Calponin-homology (CH) domain-containing protein n=1 Tax=Volvox reticuliferus TaxID=1737510 RepID=A0A8J4G1J7_9CHLO|nr:hypothetical protein Vretifemale_1095 [Volvox reticuliferus]GIL97988.1 hypothetical protein Vretimale_3533 [Volvox reticuliferus]
MTDEIGLTAQELVQAANKVIVYAGLITRVANVEEVRAVCSSSSLLVAALEGFLGRRLEDVLRTPKSPAERAYNINYVVDVLSQLLNCDLSHISGERIVEGSIEDIANILELLAVVCHGRPLQGPPPAHGYTHQEPEVADEQAPFLARAPDDAVAQSHENPVDTRHHLGLTEGLLSDSSASRSGGGASVDYSDHDADGGGGGGRSQQEYALDKDRGLSNASETCGAVRQEQQPWARYQQQQRELREEPADRHSDGFQHHQQLGQGHMTEGSREHERRGQERNQEVNASLPVRVRPRGSGRRQRICLRRAVVTAQLPLSPIQEMSREGWETSRGSKETPRLKPVDAAMRGSSGSSRAAMRSLSAGARGSTDGGSSVISVPSVVLDASRRSSGDPRGSSSRSQQSMQQQQQQQLLLMNDANSTLSRAQSSRSEGTSTLLERALSQAEATLRGLGREYEKFYYEDDEDRISETVRLVRRRRRARKDQPPRKARVGGGDGRGHDIIETGGPPAYEPARRALRAAAWPDSQSGRVDQHEAFLRRAKHALTDGRSATSTGVPPTSTSGSQSGMESRSSKHTAARLSGRKSTAARAVVAAAGHDTDKNMTSSWRGSRAGGGEAHEDLLLAMRGGTARETDTAGQGRKIMHRAPTLARGLGSQYEGTEKLHDVDAVAGIATKRHAEMQLNPELEAKLRYLYKLTAEDPRHSAARAAVESMAMANDLLRQARRRALVDRLCSARARREAALRRTADRLREQSREYDKRVEQLRLQRLAAEWSANQRSARMRRALQAELALRDAFMEVLQSEKEVLLAERQEAKAEAAAAFPGYKKALRKAESYHREILSALESLLALERQQRIRADREAEQAQRDFNSLAASVVQDRLRELLDRVAREDEATIQRRSIATQPKAKRTLLAQIRRVLGLP